MYSFADVPPGAWSLTIAVDGARETTVSSIDAVSRKATRRELSLFFPMEPVTHRENDRKGLEQSVTGGAAGPRPTGLAYRCQ